MSRFPRTLWDLIKPALQRKPSRAERSAAPKSAKRPASPRRLSMQQRYDDLVAEMKRTYGIRVRKWRSSTSGCAWEVRYHDGTTARLIEAPRPCGPVSCAVFLHEVGHHAVGFGVCRPRCLEEYNAWRWAIDVMRQRGFNITKGVEKRMAESLRYALAKALRRGLRSIPPELAPYALDVVHYPSDVGVRSDGSASSLRFQPHSGQPVPGAPRKS